MPTTAPIPPQPLHDTDGRVFAYFVPADRFDQLLAQVESLTRQRDHYAERLKQQLLAFVPDPPTEEEFARVEANPTDLSGLIADLERK
jgi:hypothetical protein